MYTVTVLFPDGTDAADVKRNDFRYTHLSVFADHCLVREVPDALAWDEVVDMILQFEASELAEFRMIAEHQKSPSAT
jgi:hypothetical protein